MSQAKRWRTPLLVLVGLRALVGIAAIPLAPFLYEEHFVVLVLMRPTKEVLLAGGFLLRLGDVHPIPLLAASIPLAVFGVWLSYFLGRAHAHHIDSANMPAWGRRLLPPKRIEKMRRLLDKKGTRLVFLGRLAAFPSTLVAAAAGSGKMPPREFLPVDGGAALLAIAEVVGAGFALGYAYRQAGRWITVAGALVLIAAAIVVARFLRRE